MRTDDAGGTSDVGAVIQVPEELPFEDIVRLVRGISLREIGAYAFSHKTLRVQLRGFRPDHPEKLPRNVITRVARFVRDNPSEKDRLMKVWQVRNGGLQDRIRQSVQPESIEDDLVRVLSELDFRDDTLPDRVYWALRLDERPELRLALGQGFLGQVADGNSLLWLKARNAHLLSQNAHLQSEVERLRKASAESAKRSERERKRIDSDKAALEAKMAALRKALGEEKERSRENAAKAVEVLRLCEQLEKSRKQVVQIEGQLKSALESYEQQKRLNDEISASLDAERQAHGKDRQALLEAILETKRLKNETTSLSSQPPVIAPQETWDRLADVASKWSWAVAQAAAAINGEKSSADEEQIDPATEWERWQAIENGLVHDFLYPQNGISLTHTAERAQRLLALRWCLLEYLKISAMTGKGVI